MKTIFLYVAFVISCLAATAQDTSCMRQHINVLASPQYYGRGYINKGVGKAADYIQQQFVRMGLKRLGANGYQQPYSFDVNTFPGQMDVAVEGKRLTPGIDFWADDASAAFKGAGKPVIIDFAKDSVRGTLRKLAAIAKPNGIYLLRNTDSTHMNPNQLAYTIKNNLPAGCYIMPWKGKYNWSESTEQSAATLLLVQDSILPEKPETFKIDIMAKLVRQYRSSNVLAYVPGTTYPDSFIVLSAHFDHLGMMGKAIFPGASDNASGTALLLCMAAYFAKHPQPCSVAFMSFSGEEAGLLGSEYYVAHPVFPLGQIRFLINMDIMGNATDGITVVNATEVPEAFGRLQQINDANKYLPVVKSRGKSHNSDHYHFTEKGVPGIFIYSNGGPGYYHDVFDKPATISFKNINGTALLIRDFIEDFNKGIKMK